ncbi:hypothetical protein [Bradyrhizobium liaoningense]|uniref:hypothetical protein n=1 Tax=Bradyrhizobium liaoningense TaxID=43992 RepID=UPI001BA80264|nr:hypothetical protein [Bradyrhizobium liaoningense]MBR1070810.1 hypothetical protein [Bradyrhizobium liaoningense]
MFFHSSREQQAAQISGVTDVFGVTLLNRNHPFPLLVEEEEKVHGALLANSTHGALLRAFGSIIPTPDSNLIVNLSPREDLSDIAPLQVYNRVCFTKDRVLSKALAIHETFAKFCGFCLQYATTPGLPERDLDALWERETSRYPLLKVLAQTIAEPRETRDYQPVFSVVYAIAKAVLNIGEFSHLLELPTARTLHDAISGSIPREPFEKRFDVAMCAIGGVGWNGLRRLSSATIDRMIVDAFIANCLHGEPPLDAATLSARSVLLGKRLASLAPGILFCHLADRHLGWKMGSWIDLDERFLNEDGTFKIFGTAQSLGGVLDSDPSLTVTYDAFTGTGTWPIGGLAEVDGGNVEETIVYLAVSEVGAIDCYTIITSTDGRVETFVDEGNDWPELESKIRCFAPERTALVMLPPSFKDFSINVPAAQLLSDALCHLAHIIYWNVSFGPGAIVRSVSYVYSPRPAAEISGVGARGPAGLMSVRSSSVGVAAAPLYAVDIIGRILSRNAGIAEPARRIREPARAMTDGVLDSEGKRVDKSVVAAVRVYERFYEYPSLPGELPFYNAIELFNAIIERGPHGGRLRT